jgi:hypothetical protein
MADEIGGAPEREVTQIAILLRVILHCVHQVVHLTGCVKFVGFCGSRIKGRGVVLILGALGLPSDAAAAGGFISLFLALKFREVSRPHRSSTFIEQSTFNQSELIEYGW